MIELTQSVHIIGAGIDKTIVTSKTGSALLSFQGPVDFYLDGISFVYENQTGGSIVYITDASLHIERCAFNGAKRNDENTTGGVGLVIRGTSTGDVVLLHIHRQPVAWH